MRKSRISQMRRIVRGSRPASVRLIAAKVWLLGAEAAEVLEGDGEQYFDTRIGFSVLVFIAEDRGADVKALVLIGNAAAVGQHTALFQVAPSSDEHGPVVVDLGIQPRRDFLAVAESGVGIGFVG